MSRGARVRDFEVLEQRRLEGARMLQRGMTQAAVARQLAVSQWQHLQLEGGAKASAPTSMPMGH